MFDSMAQGFCMLEMIHDESGRAIDYLSVAANPAFEHHTGLVDAVGKTARELVPGLEQAWVDTYAAVASTGTTHRFEQRSAVMDRSFAIEATRVGPAEARRVALLFTDITERKRAVEALRESERRFRLLADHISQFAWMADEEGSIFWYNQRWYEYTGTNLEQMAGWGWTAVHHPDHVERVVEHVSCSWQAGEPWEDIFPLRGVDGTYRWFLTRVVPIRDPSGRVIQWFGTNTDITEQRAAEERLREASRHKDDYIAMLGHELRNPLAAIEGATQLVLASRSGEPKLERAGEVLERQSRQMARLVNDLLDVSRFAWGKIEIESVSFDLRTICADVVHDRSPAVDAGVVVEVELPDDPVWIRGDSVRIVQVVDNLLSNALKFTPPPGRITLSLTAADSTAILRVDDTGVGIAADSVEHIFEPFHQVRQDVDRRHGGLGLGLALTRGLVQLHGGTIVASSRGPGAGTEFVVTLPLGPAPTAEPIVEVEDEVVGYRLLLVEDNTDAAEMMAYLLEAQGHRIRVAETAQEGLESLSGEPVDLVLCDIGLPGMSGYDFARHVRGDPQLCDIPLVALTGYGQEDDRRRSEEAGFDAHVVKPVDKASLAVLIARLAPGR